MKKEETCACAGVRVFVRVCVYICCVCVLEKKTKQINKSNNKLKHKTCACV